MLFVENPDYLKEIEDFLYKKEKKSKFTFIILLIDNILGDINFGNINNLRQLFFDYWFSEEKIPIFKNENILLTVLSYFILKINELSLKNLNLEEIMRINTVYSDFSNQIFLLIEKGDFSLFNKLEEFLYDNHFFKVFISKLVSNLDKNFEEKYKALSKVKNIIIIFLFILDFN